jgi:hypothetical protein
LPLSLRPATPALEVDSPLTPWPLLLMPSTAFVLSTVKLVVAVPSLELPTVTASPSAAEAGVYRATLAAAAAAAAARPAANRPRRLLRELVMSVVIDRDSSRYGGLAHSVANLVKSGDACESVLVVRTHHFGEVASR